MGSTKMRVLWNLKPGGVVEKIPNAETRELEVKPRDWAKIIILW